MSGRICPHVSAQGSTSAGSRRRNLVVTFMPISEEIGMNVTTKFLRRDPADVEPWAETCGQIRPLIEAADRAAAEAHHRQIDHARLPHHERTDEVYYVIDGKGTMVLDDETIELHRGVVVYVPRGVRHKAVGKLVVLTVCIPPGVLDDVHELDEGSPPRNRMPPPFPQRR